MYQKLFLSCPVESVPNIPPLDFGPSFWIPKSNSIKLVPNILMLWVIWVRYSDLTINNRHSGFRSAILDVGSPLWITNCTRCQIGSYPVELVLNIHISDISRDPVAAIFDFCPTFWILKWYQMATFAHIPLKPFRIYLYCGIFYQFTLCWISNRHLRLGSAIVGPKIVTTVIMTIFRQSRFKYTHIVRYLGHSPLPSSSHLGFRLAILDFGLPSWNQK